MDRPWWIERPIAHRGLHDNKAGVPENSLAAFAAALRAGFPMELDVTATSDGKVVVFHDEDLARMTGRPGRIRRTPAAIVTGLKLLGTENRVPYLGEVLDLLDGKVPLLVEIKSHGPVGEVEAAVLEVIQSYRGPLAIQSFNPDTLEWFKEAAPGIARGQIAGAFRADHLPWRKGLFHHSPPLDSIGQPHFIAYNVKRLSISRIARLRSQGLPVIGWTVRSPAEMAKALGGCDNVIFEGFRPSLPGCSSVL